jgi:hypothetical protein
MSKEQQELVDEVYENYKSTTLENDMKKSDWELTVQSMSREKFILSQEEFINKIKTDVEFSEKWGLTIEERELSLEERKIYMSQYSNHRIYPEWDEKFLNEKIMKMENLVT